MGVVGGGKVLAVSMGVGLVCGGGGLWVGWEDIKYLGVVWGCCRRGGAAGELRMIFLWALLQMVYILCDHVRAHIVHGPRP